jgi:hypothetical protein
MGRHAKKAECVLGSDSIAILIEEVDVISDQKLVQIASQLLQKTKAGQVRWLPDMAHEYGCTVRLPHSRIRIVGTDPLDQSAPPLRSFVVENEFGTVLGQLKVVDVSPTGKILDELLSAAIDASSRKDSVLSEIEAALDGQNMIGGTLSQV